MYYEHKVSNCSLYHYCIQSACIQVYEKTALIPNKDICRKKFYGQEIYFLIELCAFQPNPHYTIWPYLTYIWHSSFSFSLKNVNMLSCSCNVHFIAQFCMNRLQFEWIKHEIINKVWIKISHMKGYVCLFIL